MKNSIQILMLLAATAACTSGCNNGKIVTESNPPQPTVGASPPAKPASGNYTVLRKSNQAFSFVVAQGGTITLFDVTADRPVYSAQVPPQTLLRVDPQLGVYTGSTQVVKGPLPPKNTRELRIKK